jgi:hypothetical protein
MKVPDLERYAVEVLRLVDVNAARPAVFVFGKAHPLYYWCRRA